MCGRFTRMYTWHELVELYRLTMGAPSNLEPRYNICPTDTIDVVLRGGEDRSLVPMRWGLVPVWWKKPLKEMRMATFNARSDSVAEKPMFHSEFIFERRRCLIPVSGYYEWVPTPTGKQPYYFTRRDGQVITIAGIQDGWVDPVTREALRSCSDGHYGRKRVRVGCSQSDARHTGRQRFSAMGTRQREGRGGPDETGGRRPVAEMAGV